MIEIRTYHTRKVMKREKTKMNELGFRSLHTDFIDNDESKGYRVTFVNGSDIPSIDPRPPNRRLTQAQFIKELADQQQIDLI